MPPGDVASLILQLFKEVVMRYVKMGVGEFQLHKTEAHDKKVAERTKKKDLASRKVTIEFI